MSSAKDGDLQRRLSESIAELQRLRASVLQLNALKNDLIAVLAHDIKGPLTSIVGFAELLEDGYLEGEAAVDAAHTIRVNAQRLATLANDVLALSRVEHGELEIADDRIDLVEVVQNAVQTHLAERNVRVATELRHAYVRGDADRLSQVFDNLLRNAIKYSPSDKAVDVEIEAQEENYCARVRDRGIGIPPEDLPRLFGRFARGSNARRAKIAGTGIGLFIVRMIVERHGGTVGVDSTLGEGSVFTVSLPSFESGVSQRPMRAAILTGDEELRRFVAYELRSRGYRVRECKALDDLAHVGDLRVGDVALVDPAVAQADEVRKFGPPGGVRVIGIGYDPSADSWDATLQRPFLVTDLLAAVNPS
jgi:signal transduction histidine kinase